MLVAGKKCHQRKNTNSFLKVKHLFFANTSNGQLEIKKSMHNKKTAAYRDVIIVGAGHSGLSVSYFLKQKQVEHIVFERGETGNSWATQRWDSFALNTPTCMNILPGDKYEGDCADGFMHRDEFVTYLKQYADKFQLPVLNNTNVFSVQKNQDENVFEVSTESENEKSDWICKQVVIASGIMSEAKMSPLHQSVPGDIFQIHAADFRNQGQLPAGAVLVVGGGQSGCQIAEGLLTEGRKVYLATSKVGRYPRRYRGRDILDWAVDMKFFDVLKEEIKDPAILTAPNPHISGIGRLGHTLSLQSLFKQGAIILGRLDKVNGYEMTFKADAAENVRHADQFSAWFKKLVDKYIDKNQLSAAPPYVEPADQPDIEAVCASAITALNLRTHQIGSVIWTTGYTADFSWISPSVTDETGMPVHNKGVSAVSGLYFIGFPWLVSRKSGIVYGMPDDAGHIANLITDSL